MCLLSVGSKTWDVSPYRHLMSLARSFAHRSSFVLVTLLTGCASVLSTNTPPANAQSCAQLRSGIKNISTEIKEIQLQAIGDNSAPRATMRASRMAFGASAQSNLIAYGRSMGCQLSGLELPLSIRHQQNSQGAADL